MPKHYALDGNVFRGQVHFDDTKTAFVYFINHSGQQVNFTQAPFVALTVLDMTEAPAIKQSWLKNGSLFIGIKIKFTNNYTGDVAWEVKE